MKRRFQAVKVWIEATRPYLPRAAWYAVVLFCLQILNAQEPHGTRVDAESLDQMIAVYAFMVPVLAFVLWRTDSNRTSKDKQ